MSDAISKAGAAWRAKQRQQARQPKPPKDLLHPTFKEWRAWWGVEKHRERIRFWQKIGRGKWDDIDDIEQFPAWELVMGTFWEESIEDWRERWIRCGGKLFDGRMIVCKRDPIWTKLSSTFPDGLGKPYPPFAKSSCAHWLEIGCDECAALGLQIDAATMAAYEQSEEAKELDEDLQALEGAGVTLDDLRAAKSEVEKSRCAFCALVKIVCPACAQHIEMPGRMLNQVVTCPTCNCTFPARKAEMLSPHRIK